MFLIFNIFKGSCSVFHVSPQFLLRLWYETSTTNHVGIKTIKTFDKTANGSYKSTTYCTLPATSYTCFAFLLYCLSTGS